MIPAQDIPTQTTANNKQGVDISMPAANDATALFDVNSPNYSPQQAVDISKLPPRTFVSNNPIHTTVTQAVPNTSDYFKLLLPALATRYLFRGVIDSQRGMDMVPALKSKVNQQWNIIQKAIKSDLPAASDAAIHELQKSGYVFSAKEKLSKAIENKSEILSKFKNNKLDGYYDNVLGAGSLVVTASFESRVYKDIKNMFAETVAYETGKQPEDVSFSDLRHSNNAIVQTTLKNFRNNAMIRFGSDLGFFGKHLSKISPKLGWINAMKVGDIMIGVKAAQLIADINKKETTILEDMLSLVDRKLNPVKGLGDSIAAHDIIDLYQKYAINDNPSISFKDSTIYQQSDDMKWPQAEEIFTHIADLMNQTYKYKHSSLDDISRIEHVNSPKIDFTLPKFIYMLGEGNINPHKPEETYAKIEIAARFGSNSLKDANQIMARGGTLEEVIAKYPVDISTVRTVTGADGTEQSYSSLDEKPKRNITTPAMHEMVQDNHTVGVQH